MVGQILPCVFQQIYSHRAVILLVTQSAVIDASLFPLPLDNFKVNGRGIAIGTKGKISDITSADPVINVDFTAEAYLDTLSNLFPATSGSQFEGTITADLGVNSRLSNLNLYRLGNAGSAQRIPSKASQQEKALGKP